LNLLPNAMHLYRQKRRRNQPTWRLIHLPLQAPAAVSELTSAHSHSDGTHSTAADEED
jgi:hypothetical protein